MELFDFIVGLGSTKAAFIPLLLEFCQCFVNSKRRGLRLSAFGVAKKYCSQHAAGQGCSDHAVLPERAALQKEGE